MLALLVLLFFPTLGLAQKPPQPANAEAPQRTGRFITVDQPINDAIDLRLETQTEQALAQARDKNLWPVIVFEIQPGKSDYLRAMGLANFITGPKFQGATTIAFLPETVTGHALLVALACDQIVLGKNATLGSAGQDETTIDADVRSGYLKISQRRQKLPDEIVLGMLDRALEVHLVEADVEGQRRERYLLADQLADWRTKHNALDKGIVIKSGELGVFTSQEARNLGFVSLLADTRDELADSFGMPRESMLRDPFANDKPRVVQIDLKGPTKKRATDAASKLSKAIAAGKNFVIFWIDSPGGEPAESLLLASEIARLDPAQVRTVAYIPREALADAAMVALACDLIVMAPGAKLGGSGAAYIYPDILPGLVTDAQNIAQQKHRSPALASAIFDDELQVFRYERIAPPPANKFMTEAEAAKLSDAASWQRREEVTLPHHPFQATGREAMDQYHLAWKLAENFDEFKTLFNLEQDPDLQDPGWTDFIVDALSTDEATLILIFIAFGAFYAEIHGAGMGIGIGWLVSGLCFALLFWSRCLGGTAGWLEVVLFLVGACFVLLEFFVFPGVAVFGLTGGVLMLVSLILASQTFFLIPRNEYQTWQMTKSMLTLVGSGVMVGIFGLVLRQYLPHSRFFNKMMLHPPTAEELAQTTSTGSSHQTETLVGKRGQAITHLVPSGKIRVGERIFDVMAEGEFIDSGAPIEIIEALGNRIIVRQVEVG